jgi:predicted PurR-regulated permease PerM
MRKKELEKLELDIAREKDREVADRLKAVLETRKSERCERELQLKRRWKALRRVIRITFIVAAIIIGGMIAIGLLVAWVTGEFSR